MSGRIRGSSSCVESIRTRTVAFCRSADGTVVMTCAGIRQSGYASSTASTVCAGPHAVDVALVHVHLDLERRHVHDRADAGAREAAAGRHRRDHLARLRVLRDRDAAERRAHHHVGQVGLRRLHLALATAPAVGEAIRAFSDSTSASRVSSSARPMTPSFSSCCRRSRLSSASRSRAWSSAALCARARAAPRATASGRSHLRVVQPRQHLSAPYGLSFLDEDLEHLAGHLRRDRRPPASGHIARRRSTPRQVPTRRPGLRGHGCGLHLAASTRRLQSQPPPPPAPRR